MRYFIIASDTPNIVCDTPDIVYNTPDIVSIRKHIVNNTFSFANKTARKEYYLKAINDIQQREAQYLKRLGVGILHFVAFI